VRRSIVINATVFPRSLFEFVKFDEQIRYGYDEVDIANAAVAAGFVISYSDDLVVKHYPSSINRDEYTTTDLGRLYVTEKIYRIYRPSKVRALTFTLLAPTHHLLHTLKTRPTRLRRAFNECKEAKEMLRQHRQSHAVGP
jgi:hypothetical protein